MTRMKDYRINLFYSEEDAWYIAEVPDLGSCSAFGDTPQEALREVRLAQLAWLESVSRLPSRDHSTPAKN